MYFCPLMLNKPVVAISFHEKVDSLMSALGLDAYCQDIENIDLERLTTQLAALETNADLSDCKSNKRPKSIVEH